MIQIDLGSNKCIRGFHWYGMGLEGIQMNATLQKQQEKVQISFNISGMTCFTSIALV